MFSGHGLPKKRGRWGFHPVFSNFLVAGRLAGDSSRMPTLILPRIEQFFVSQPLQANPTHKVLQDPAFVGTSQLITFATTPAPTVLPPSRKANLWPVGQQTTNKQTI